VVCDRDKREVLVSYVLQGHVVPEGILLDSVSVLFGHEDGEVMVVVAVLARLPLRQVRYSNYDRSHDRSHSIYLGYSQ